MRRRSRIDAFDELHLTNRNDKIADENKQNLYRRINQHIKERPAKRPILLS